MQGGYDQGPYGPRPHERRYSNGPPPPPTRMPGGPPMHMGASIPPPDYYGPPPPRRRSRSPARGPFRGGPTHAPYPPAHAYAPPPKLTDPFTIKELVNYDYFQRWYHALNPGNSNADEATVRARYDDYVADTNLRTSKEFVSEQESMPWFAELYGGFKADGNLFDDRFSNAHASPEEQAANYEAFAAKLASGEFKQEDTSAQATTSYIDRSASNANLSAEPQSGVVFIKSIAPKVPRSDLQAFVAAQLSIKSLSISRPNTKVLRSGWIRLQDETSTEEAVKKLEGRILTNERVGEFAIHVSPYRPAQSRLSLFPQHDSLTHASKHLETLTQLAAKFEAKFAHPSLWEQIIESYDGDEALSPEVKASKTVDLAVAYLRQVFFFDFWTATLHDSLLSLSHYAPGYVRATDSSEMVDDRRFEHWTKQHSDKILMLLEPLEYLQQRKVKPLDAALHDAIHAKIKREDETRFRCGIEDCAKLFKDVPFVEKHLHKRHADWVESQKSHLQMLYRYLCDPGKLVLPKTAPAEQRRTEAPRGRSNGPPMTDRRRSPPNFRRDQGGYYDSPDRRGPPPPARVYRDLDRPAEPVVELDY